MDLEVVKLAENQTHVSLDRRSQTHAIQTAHRVNLSPHEWDWSTSEAAAMAQFVLWAHQRLCAIEQVAAGPLNHSDERQLRGIAMDLEDLARENEQVYRDDNGDLRFTDSGELVGFNGAN